ncbi:MAG: DUF1616 domain-containing protein [Chloroflexi bacterium]|nr:DUF1616 domain-containing protein [Chloroflexota bacterium]
MFNNNGQRPSENDRVVLTERLRVGLSQRSLEISRILSFVLVAALLGAVAALIYSVAVPFRGEKFTEFYILGTGGKATGYPTRLAVGQEGRVLAGIVNQEQRTISYRIMVSINGEEAGDVGPLVLDDREKWEGQVSFTADQPGLRQKVEFILYADETDYQRLHLWVDVTE